MAWIEMHDDRDWEGELAGLRPEVADPTYGRVDNILAIHSLDAGSLRAHLALYRQAMRGTATLPKVDREMIALVVSAANDCHYWVTHHRRGLRRLLRDNELAARIEDDWPTAGLDDRRTAMLAYAVKLTREPWAMTSQDVAALREAGFSDTDVLHIAEVAGYYAYVNRLADGLGVELESWIPDDAWPQEWDYAAFARSLALVDTARTDADTLVAPPGRATGAERAFNTSMIVSGIRCTLTYVILPFVAPLIGLAPGVGPAIGIPVGLVAIVANVVSIRRFHHVQHRWRWPVTFVHLGVIGLLVALVAVDVASLL